MKAGGPLAKKLIASVANVIMGINKSMFAIKLIKGIRTRIGVGAVGTHILTRGMFVNITRKKSVLKAKGTRD